ncbi:helix-turn-helix transcriptional regulator [Virgibacillus sp. LDC-1]|uniref:helix-turn-helix transcriptional regulator n=1 Tax=Virgibacillus sp. LDC-1 TaxID=3039856 RepID=UPI0024DE7328|nr:helix-turn-helix transcriptional regulator [Virgibacillus sp. LDC-1]
MSQNESYTTEEIARLLKVSKLTVYDLIKKGELQAFRVGRQMRVDAMELEHYKRRGQQGVSAPVQAESRIEAGSEQAVVISGQDNSLDILAQELENKSASIRPLRTHKGSLDGLIAMYEGKVAIASVHLFDGDTGKYNIPYVRKLLVSQSFIVFRFIKRTAGLYVASGNPKEIYAWADLKKPNIVMVNREPGAGARVLLDEKFRLHHINKQAVAGYSNEQSSHLNVASMIANGSADVGVGIETVAKVAGIDFVPMVEESYDLVVLKTAQNNALINHLNEILTSKQFQKKLASLGYQTAGIGDIIWEQ